MTAVSNYNENNGNGFAQKWGAFIQTISLVTVVVSGLWIVGIHPIDSEIFDIKQKENTFVTKEVMAIRDHQFEMLENRVRIMANDQLVPKSTHELIWNKDKEDKIRIQDSINELRKDLGGTYSLRDAMADLQKRLDRLESSKSTQPTQLPTREQ